MAIKEFRVAYTVEDFQKTAAFFRDGLGLGAGDLWTDNGNGQMFIAGKAILEVFDHQYAAGVDQIEAEKRISGQIRFAIEVDDIEKSAKRAIEFGGKLVHEAVTTPWGDKNIRLESPEGLQITLYQRIDHSL